MKYDELINQILENVEGMDTFWEDETGKTKVTIKDVVKYLDDSDIPVKNVSIDKIKPIIIDQDYKNKNKKRVEASNLEYPIIVIKKNGKYKSILDGNHRAFKAVNSDKKSINVREIDLSSSNTPKEYKYLFDYKISPLY
jgi:hypothetical protein